MQHFIDINQLSETQIYSLINRALYFKTQSIYPKYPQCKVASLFYENSTRTRVSFELAATNLKMQTINIDLQHSSESKGEIIFDTINTLAAMGIQVFVIRHKQNELPQAIANGCHDQSIHIVNAGDGTHAHPSQAMLDLMTIVEKKTVLSQLKIAIVGDIRHSRVANSLLHAFERVKVKELMLIAPEVWQPESVSYGRVTSSLQEGLSQADVVIGLRVQRERLESNEQFDLTCYRKYYALTRDHIAWAKADAIIMHPGPMNRDIEIDSEIADGSQSVILDQVKNGVFMRMAILETLQLANQM